MPEYSDIAISARLSDTTAIRSPGRVSARTPAEPVHIVGELAGGPGPVLEDQRWLVGLGPGRELGHIGDQHVGSLADGGRRISRRRSSPMGESSHCARRPISVPSEAMAEQLVGGQALIDGVMIRRGQRWAAASRLDDGTLVTVSATAPLALAPVRGVPVLRGIGALIDSLQVGAAAMRWSGQQRGDSPVRTTRDRLVVAGVVGIVLATFLLVPLTIGARLSALTGWSWMLGPVEGLVRLGFFVAYLAMLSRLAAYAARWNTTAPNT